MLFSNPIMHWSFWLYIEAYSSTQQPPPRMAIMKMRHGQSDWLRWGLDITLRFLVFFPIVEDFQSLELQLPVCPIILFCVVLDSCSSLMFCGFLPGSPFPQARGERLENICDSRRCLFAADAFSDFSLLKNRSKTSGGFKNQNGWKYVVFLCQNEI